MRSALALRLSSSAASKRTTMVRWALSAFAGLLLIFEVMLGL
jgi:hypothetical protein